MSEPVAALDERAQRRIASLFFGFGVVAVVVIVLGLALAIVEETSTGAALSRPVSWPTPSALWRDLRAFSAQGVLGLGLSLLLLLPLVRNATVTLLFLRRRRPRPALLAVVVMLALIALYAGLAVAPR